MDTDRDKHAGVSSDLDDLPQDIVPRSDRDRIMGGVAEAIMASGYEATSVEEICSRAGVERETFDQLFQGKDDALLATANTLLGEIVAIVSQRLSPDKPIHQMVRDALAAVLTLLAQRPVYAYVIFVEGRTLTPAVRQVYNSGVGVLMSLLEQTRIDGPVDGPSPAIAARAACGSVGMAIRHEVLRGRTEHLPELLPAALYSFLVPFLGQDQALTLAEDARAHPPQFDFAPYGRAHF
jgi:AcrR family transcriptional regulator